MEKLRHIPTTGWCLEIKGAGRVPKGSALSLAGPCIASPEGWDWLNGVEGGMFILFRQLSRAFLGRFKG